MGATVFPRFNHLPGAVKAALMLSVAIVLVVFNMSSLSRARQLKDNEAFALSSEVLYIPNVVQLRLMTLGYDQTAADLVWIRTLEYFARHFNTDRRYRWLEHFLEQIIRLDPQFHKVYHWAGANVLYGRQFTNENVKRSNHFYELALQQRPDDYEAAYRLGLNYYVEMKSTDEDEARKFRETGLEYLERAANTPDAPQRMRRLVASISSRLGKKQIALQYLVDMYLQTTDPELRAQWAARIAELRDELGTGSMVDEAKVFRHSWQKLYPYVSPGLYAMMGQPMSNHVSDTDWQSLTTSVDLTADKQQ
ncbi:MAG: hypothetical protein VX589_00810 [Myxococcota bacterium]|nr:hypothetical protein [Myxococcota bacterium]